MTTAPTEPQTLMAFDFGERRLGVAVGQRLGATSRAVTTVPCSQGQPSWQAVDELIRSWRPDALVVGLPRHLDDADHPLAGPARAFADELQRRFGLAVQLVDERLSSVEADERLRDQRRAGRRSRIRRGERDAEAARVILQTYLEHRDEAAG